MSSASKATRVQQEGGRALPWLSYLLAAACLCVFSFSQSASSRAREAAEAELQQAVLYLSNHPYLEPGPILASRIDVEAIEKKRDIGRNMRERRGAPPIPQRVQQREQKRLDELVEAAYAGLDALPPQRWGFRATKPEPLTALTYVFFHAGAAHLSGVLLLLLLLGFHLETAWGSKRFFLFALAAATVSAGAFAVGNPEFPLPLIGMSGVIAALLGAFLIRFRTIWTHPIYAFLAVGGSVFLFLPVSFGTEWSVATGIEQESVRVANLGASYWALASGLLFGLLTGLANFVFTSEPSAPSAPAESRRTRHANPVVDKAARAQAEGRLNEAFSILTDFLRQNPDDCDALLAMWNVGLDCARTADAASAMLRAIREEVKRGDASAATEHWLQLSQRGLDADAEPALLIRLALMLRECEQPFPAIAALQKALQRASGASVAVVAARVARVSRDLDVETARDAAWRALGSADLDLEERQSLENLLAEIGPGISTVPTGGSFGSRALDLDLGEEAYAGDELGSSSPPAASGAQTENLQWEDPELLEGSERRPPSDAEMVELHHVVHFEDPPQPSEGEVEDFARAQPIDLDVDMRSIEVVAALPVELGTEGLLVEFENGDKRRVPFSRLEAISVAAVGNLSAKPVILIDLLTNWSSGADEPLRVIRIRCDHFDARRFVSDTESPLDALRSFIQALVRTSRAQPLPDEQSATGMPFASFDDLASYQRHVLNAEQDDPITDSWVEN